MASKGHCRRLIALACPVYFQLLAGVVAGVIDVFWVARLGTDAVAAVAMATSVEAVLLGVVLMAGSGTTVLVAAAHGGSDREATRTAVRGGWSLLAILTPPVAIGGWAFREPLAVLLLGGDSGAAGTAAAYFAVAMPGIAVFFGQQMVDGILKGTGDTRTPMRLALLASALILVLDPLMIFGWLGLPALGAPGAALATVIGRAVPLAIGVLVLRRNAVLRAARRLPARVSRTAALRRTVSTGWPMSADFLVRMVGSLALVAVIARIGPAAAAGYGIALKAMYAATMGFYAVRQAAAIHTAHTRGTGRDERAGIGRQAMAVSGGFGLLTTLVLLGAAPWIMRLFGAAGAAAEAGTVVLRCTGPYLLLLACLIALGGVFEGSGGAPRLLRITLLGTAVLLPLAGWLSRFGLAGVTAAMALSTALQLAVLLRNFRRTEGRAVATVSTKQPAYGKAT